MIRKTLLILLMVMVSAGSSSAYVKTWTVFTVPEYSNPLYPGVPDNMTFTLKNNILSLNTAGIGTQGGSTAEGWSMLFSGNWAVCGTVDATGNLTADPYANFVTDVRGGYIQWDPNTPHNYRTSLLLGYRFNGDGAAAYQSILMGQPSGPPVTGTLVINNYLAYRPDEKDHYTPISHAFTKVKYHPAPIPEPGGVLAVIATGLTAAFGGLRRYTRRAR